MNGQASEHMNSTSSPISSGSPEPFHRHVFEETLHQLRRGLRCVLERRLDRARRDRQRADALRGVFARHSQGHRHDRAFRRGVMHRRAEAAAPMRHARHVDDDAELVLEHMRQHCLHAVKRAVDVEIERFLHQIVVDVEELRAADRSARGIEQEMDVAEGGEGARHHVVDLRARGDVDFERQGLAALAVDLRCGLSRAGFVEVGADHVGPLAREDQRRGAADAACGAGDNDGLAGEIVRCLRHGGLCSLRSAIVPGRQPGRNRKQTISATCAACGRRCRPAAAYFSPRRRSPLRSASCSFRNAAGSARE